MSKKNPVIGPQIHNQKIPRFFYQLIARQLLLSFILGLYLAFSPFTVCRGADVAVKKILFIYAASPNLPAYALTTKGFKEQIRENGHFQPEYFFEYLDYARWQRDAEGCKPRLL